MGKRLTNFVSELCIYNLIILCKLLKVEIDMKDMVEYELLNENLMVGQEAQRCDVAERVSEYVQEYQSFFKDLPDKRHIDMQRLANQGIKYQPSSPHQKQASISIHKKSRNSQIVILEMRWGRFEQLISILNYLHPNGKFSAENQYKQDRNKSILYERRWNKNWIVFKCQSFSSNNRSSRIMAMLKEVFIGKIASALELGPKCCTDTCFDIFLYENAIEFGMEKCISHHQREFASLDFNSIRQGLRLMHALKIIHYDIKPDNIMFSSRQKKLVIIDFNLSEITDIKLGKKVQIPFKGTVYYCYSEMAENFILTSNLTFIDPYYNDAHCLKESQTSLKQQLINYQKIGGNYFDQIEIQAFQGQFLIISLKYLLFNQRWRQSQKLYQKFKSFFQQSALQQLSYFMYELNISNDLQTFFYTCIPQKERESLLMREFNYLLSKKWMNMSTNFSTTQSKRDEFESRLQLDMGEGVMGRKLRDKKDWRHYLQDSDKFQNETVIYFNVFLDYISYHNNQHQVDRRQRQQAVSICSNFLQKYLHDSLPFLREEKRESQMAIVLVYIMNWLVKNNKCLKQKSHQKVHKINYFQQALWKILLFMFILDIGSLQQNFIWFEQIIDTFSTTENRLAVILQIDHLNQFNRYRIKPKKQVGRYKTFIKMREYMHLKFSQLKEKQWQELGKMVGSEMNGWSLQQFLNQETFHEQLVNNLHNISSSLSSHRLRETLKSQAMIKCLNTQSLHDFNFVSEVYKALLEVNYCGFPQLKPQFLDIYDRYRFYGQNNCSLHVYKIFKRNLNEEGLQKEFRIYYNNQIINLSSLNLEQRIDQYYEYINKIQGEDLIFHQDMMENIEVMVRQLAAQSSFSNNQTKFIRLKGKIDFLYRKLILISSSFHSQRNQLLDSFSIHFCFRANDFIGIFTFNLRNFQKISQYRAFLRELRQVQAFKECPRCNRNLNCFEILCLQAWILNHKPDNAQQLTHELDKQWKMVCENVTYCSGNQQKSQFIGFYANILVNFALFHCYSQYKYRGLQDLYHFIKQHKELFNESYMWIYLGAKCYHKILLKQTMQVLFQLNIQEFINFLKMVAEYLQAKHEQQTYNMILYTFAELVSRIENQSQLNLFQLIKSKCQGAPLVRNIFRIYLYVLAIQSKDVFLQLNTFKVIALTLYNLPFDFQNQYQSEIHRFLVLKLRMEGKQFSRQERYLNNQLIRILIRLGKRAINQKKIYPKLRGPQGKKLRSKLEAIQGPFLIRNQDQEIFWFQMKKRPSS